ncbi:cGMP-specific 3',5'-cyclic phosphodiesterase, partial [Rhizophlyctis rosea]
MAAKKIARDYTLRGAYVASEPSLSFDDEENHPSSTEQLSDIPPDLRGASFFFSMAKTINGSLNLADRISSVLSVAVELTYIAHHKLIHAERCSLFLVDHQNGELYSTVWDVMPKSLSSGSRSGSPSANMSRSDSGDNVDIRPAPNLGAIREFRIPIGSGVAGWVAQTGVTARIEDAYTDKRFNQEADRKSGLRTRTMLCMPVFSKPPEEIHHSEMSCPMVKRERGVPIHPNLIGIATLINKLPSDDDMTPFPPFSDKDEKLFGDFLLMCGIAINNSILYEKAQEAEKIAMKLAAHNAKLLERSALETKKTKVLLQIAESLYGDHTVNTLGQKVIEHAQELTNAETASLFILDEEKNELYPAVIDAAAQGKKFTIPLGKGISGHVAQTGEVINLRDAYEDPRFFPDIDLQSDSKTQSILSVPIPGPSKKFLGVANLINKRAITPDSSRKIIAFDEEDVAIFRAFSVFCGLSLHKTLMLNQINKQQRMLTVTMELMSFHATSHPSDFERFLKSVPEDPVRVEDLRSSEFDPHDFDTEDNRLVVVVRMMFVDMGFAERFEIPTEKWDRYVLTVRKNYRPVAYHNFVHAVSVAHLVYWLVKSGTLEGYADDIEQFSMFIAALNHDIDHRGTNNQFQKNAQTALAAFYSTSTMERHHFNHAMTILSAPGHNILDAFDADSYARCLKVFENAILATDLALYFANKGKIGGILERGEFDRGNGEHRELLRGMIMTCSDLSAMTKPFHCARRTADHVYEEFFVQGEEERRMNLPYSAELMDRSKSVEIPRMQLGFMDFIVRPAYELLDKMLDGVTGQLMDAVKRNMEEWRKLKESGEP